jgi:hypothetical protein
MLRLREQITQPRILALGLILTAASLEFCFHNAKDEQSVNQWIGRQQDLSPTAPNNNQTFDKFGFYLMGDTPYADWEDQMLQYQISNLHKNKQSNILFTVHIGDIQKVQRTNCDETHYAHIANVLKGSPVPTFMIPGDNDWFDCIDRQTSFSLFRQYLTHLDQDWHHTFPVVRDEVHPELLALEHDGILFLSIHLINSRINDEPEIEFQRRMTNNQRWVRRQLDHYFATTYIRGVVILGHSLRSPRTRPFFEFLACEFLKKNRGRLDVPVVYLHGDGHNWDVDHKFSHQMDWKYFYDVQIDQGAYADPCIVEFAKQMKGKMIPLRQEHENQLLLGRGLIRIDRQRGRYSKEYLELWADARAGR